MNKKMIKIFNGRIYLFIAIFYLIFVRIAFCETPEGIHYQTGIYYPYQSRKIKFRDVPADLPFIMKFPIEKLLNDPTVKEVAGQQKGLYDTYIILQFDAGEGKTEIVRLDYWVYTSVSDAEESIVERLLTQNLAIISSIDLNPEWGNIGDNSWYYKGDYVPIFFIRNNVRVIIEADCDWCPYNSDVILEFAKKVDDLIINTEKVEDVKLIPAPVINSMELVSGEPKIGELSTFNIDAVDPNGQKLKYRFFGESLSHVTDNSLVSTKLLSDLLTGALTTNKIKLWVYNEDHIVASAEYF